MKNFNFEGFKKELKIKATDSFGEYKEKYGTNHLSGFSFYTDESFMSLSVFLNNRNYQNEPKDEQAYYRFAVDEWVDENEYPDKQLNSLMSLLEDKSDDKFFIDPEYSNGICRSLVEAIIEMKEEDVFDGVGADFIWNVAISDFSNPPLEIEIFKHLNTPEIANEFEQYLISEYEICGTDEWSYEKGKWVNHY